MTLRLFHSTYSPFVRKVMVAAAERGVTLERLSAKVSPVSADADFIRHNPVGKIPCVLLPDDTPVFDSRVITALIDSRGSQGETIYPQDERRFTVLTLEALADAMLDAALLCRYEMTVRPEEQRWDDWIKGQMAKIDSALTDLESRWLPALTTDFHAGAIAIACTLGYLDFRFADKDWRQDRPQLADWYAQVATRPSMMATRPVT